MLISKVEVENLGFGGIPSGITAEIGFKDCNTVFEVYRSWDNPQWYLYDITFNEDGARAGIEDIDYKYPVSQNSDLHTELEKAIDSVRADFSPA